MSRDVVGEEVWGRRGQMFENERQRNVEGNAPGRGLRIKLICTKGGSRQVVGDSPRGKYVTVRCLKEGTKLHSPGEAFY